MKITGYFLGTISPYILHRGMKPMDVNLILYRIGKALGMVQ